MFYLRVLTYLLRVEFVGVQGGLASEQDDHMSIVFASEARRAAAMTAGKDMNESSTVVTLTSPSIPPSRNSGVFSFLSVTP